MPERLDRAAFWLWAVCLMIAHIVLTLLTASGTPFGALDTVAVIAFALVVGARFRDIGWPVWIGITFVLVTTMALPLAATGYEIASNLRPPEFLRLMGWIGLFTGPVNLLLMIVAGSVAGMAPASSTEASTSVVMPLPSAVAPEMMATAASASDPPQLSEEATSQPSAAPASPGLTALMVGGGALALLIAGIFIVRAVPRAPVSAAAPAPQAPYLQSNGLTKDTNDFLRQLSGQRPAR